MVTAQRYEEIKPHFHEILFSGRSYDYLSEIVSMVSHFEPNVECMQDPKHHPEGSVAVHTCMVIDVLAPRKDIELSFSALFHDLGKAYTQVITVREDGADKISFVDHEKVSASFVKIYETLIKGYGADTDCVEFIVRNHMRAHKYASGEMKKKSKRTQLEKSLWFEKLMLFQRADILGRG